MVEKNKAKLEAKINKILALVEEGVAGDNESDDDSSASINSEELRCYIAEFNQENWTKEEQKATKTLENKYFKYIFYYKIAFTN